jgi:hypothetical protein
MVGIRFPLGRIARRGVPFGSGANMDALNVRDKHLPQAAQRRFSMAEVPDLVGGMTPVGTQEITYDIIVTP